MDGLLERANFRIKNKVMRDGVIGRYLCTKDAESAVSGCVMIFSQADSLLVAGILLPVMIKSNK